MGYEQPKPLFSYMYSRLALDALLSSIHQKKPIHGFQLFLAAAAQLSLKHAKYINPLTPNNTFMYHKTQCC